MLRALLSHSVKEISVNNASALPNAIYLDAREPAEYGVSHIHNAKFVGYNHFSLDSVKNIPKNAPIIVYCSVGYRSEKVAEKLQKQGFTNIQNLYGGIFEWVNEGQKVYNATDTTSKVHAFSRSWGIWLNKGEKVY